MSFEVWKNLPPVQKLADRLGITDLLENSNDWNDYSFNFIDANDDGGHLVKAAQELWGYLSSGEEPVLAAMLHAADFSRYADELSGDRTWRRIDPTDKHHRAAVALAILRQ